MIIIFQCFGGTHTSVVAASLYTGQLSRRRAPRTDELIALPYYDRMDSSEMGKLHFIGPDKWDNPVFALGSGKWGAEIREILAAFLELPYENRQTVAVIDCLPTINTVTRIGGYISRRLGLTRIGRPLVNRGIQSGYPRLLHLVESFEKNADLSWGRFF